MKVIGCAFTTYRGAVRTAYVPLDDLTVIVGPNDTGKSSVLNAMQAASAVTPDDLMPPGADLWEGTLPGFVWFTSLNDFELSVLKERCIFDTLDEPEEAIAPDMTLVSEITTLEKAFGEPVIAFELYRWEDENNAGEINVSWKTLLCARRREAIKPSSWDFADREYLRVPGAPVPVSELPYDPTVPQAVSVPLRDPRALDRHVEDALTDFLHTVWDKEDVDADLAATAWQASERGGTVLRVRAAVIEACSEFGIAATQFLPAFVHGRYDISIRVNPIGQWERLGKIAVELHARAEDARFPVEDAAEGYRLWIQLAVLETALRAKQKALALRTLQQVRDLESHFKREGFDLQTLEEPVRMLEAIESQPLGTTTSIPRDAHAILQPVWRYLSGFAADVPDVLTRPLLYLIDEPEQHLNPKLQRAAAQWLQNLVEAGGSQVVMATHAHPFLELRGAVNYISTHRGQGHAVLQTFDPSQLEALDLFSAEMGFDRGELLARVRVLLFVEGPADRAVIETLFQDQLRTSGTQIIELRGIAFAHAVIDDVLVKLTGTRVAILLDKITTEAAQEMAEDPSRREELALESHEAEQLRRLLKAADRAGRRIHPFGLGLPDILDVLDDRALRQLAPGWPGHEKAQRAWEACRQGPRAKGTPHNRKAFYEYHYGLSSKVETFSHAAELMAARGERPTVLAEIIFEIERLALD